MNIIGIRFCPQVIRSAVTKPIEEQIVALIDEYGDDFADFAFHTNNHKRNGVRITCRFIFVAYDDIHFHFI